MAYLLMLSCASVLYWLAFPNELAWLWDSWLHNPFYSHGLIIIAACLALIVINARKAGAIQFNVRPFIFWLLCAAVLVGAGWYFRFRYAIAVSYVVMCLGINEGVLRQDVKRYFRLPVLLMLLVVPVPYLYDIVGFFSVATTAITAAVLKLLYPSMVQDGADISIAGGICFTIGGNCGGANAILALVTVMLLWLVVVRHKPWIAATLMLLTVPIGFVVNALRVVSIFVIARVVGMQTAAGLWHDFAGYFFYMTALAIMVAVWWALCRRGRQDFRFRRLFIP